MKYSRPARTRTRTIAAAVAVAAALVVTACSSDEDTDAAGSSTSSVTAAPTTTEAQDALPAAAELGAVLDKAVDPALQPEQKFDTVEDGDQAVDLFDVMTRTTQDSGVTFRVVDPVAPGDAPEIALVTVNVETSGQEPAVVDKVSFVRQGDQWKLSRQGACTLVGQVAPDQVPPLCAEVGVTPAVAPESTPAPVPEETPAPAAEPAPAPAPEVPQAPAGDPAIRDALLGAGVDQATADALAADPEATVAAAERMGIDRATADQFRSNPQGAIDALRAAGIDPVTAAPMLAAQL